MLVSFSTSRNLLVSLDIASIGDMDDALNPYTPGSGIAPTVLTGRERDLHAFDNLVKRVQNGLLGRPMLLVGLRGVGKTVLLNQEVVSGIGSIYADEAMWSARLRPWRRRW